MKIIFSFLISSFFFTIYAAYFDPFVYDICSLDKPLRNTFKTYSVSNVEDYKTGISIDIKRVNGVDKNNIEIREDVDFENINWYPKQFIIPAKSSKTFRVQLNILKNPLKEYSYRVIMKEIKLNYKNVNKANLPKNMIRGSVKLTFGYTGWLFIDKCLYKSKFVVNSFRLNDTKDMIYLEIQNIGKASSVLTSSRLSLVLINGNKRIPLEGNFKKDFRIFPSNIVNVEFKLLQKLDYSFDEDSNIIMLKK